MLGSLDRTSYATALAWPIPLVLLRSRAPGPCLALHAPLAAPTRAARRASRRCAWARALSASLARSAPSFRWAAQWRWTFLKEVGSLQRVHALFRSMPFWASFSTLRTYASFVRMMRQSAGCLTDCRCGESTCCRQSHQAPGSTCCSELCGQRAAVGGATEWRRACAQNIRCHSQAESQA